MTTRRHFCLGGACCAGFAAVSLRPGVALAQDSNGSRFMTPEQEAQIGKQQNEEVLAQYGGAYKDTNLQAFIDQVGNRLVQVTPMAGQPFHFTIVDTAIVNAFALPGGYVYATRGLLALAESEAEVAGVLGHEIGHVVGHHTALRYDRQIYGSGLAMGAQILGGLLGGYFGGQQGAQLGQQLLGQAGQLGSEYYVQSFSREQEYEADQYGVRFMGAAGFDPRAMASFLTALETNQAYETKKTGQQSAVPSWLQSHPRTPERVARVASAAAEATPSARQIGRDAYLHSINGAVYGEDPKQGIVNGNHFEHPDLGFAFDAPDGFRLQNSPTAVMGTDGNGRLMKFDVAPSGTDDPYTYLRDEWAAKARLSDVQQTTVHGAPAAYGFAPVQINDQPAAAMLAAVRKGSSIYRFIFASTQELTSSDRRAFEDSLASFHSISSAAGPKPLRIEVVRVKAGDTRSSLAARMDVRQLKDDLFAMLNGFDRGRRLASGQDVKLVRRGGESR